jgi:hypothetical protein
MKPENFTTLSKLELEAMAKALPHMSVIEKMELFDDLELRESRAKLQAAKTNMLGFAQAVYPGFKIGPHHKKLAKIFTDVVEGRKKRPIRVVSVSSILLPTAIHFLILLIAISLVFAPIHAVRFTVTGTFYHVVTAVLAVSIFT